MAVFQIEEGADTSADVLCIHAPYPGVLRFESQPSSLLSALAPFAASPAVQSGRVRLGLLDPGNSSEEFYEELRALLRDSACRVVCISTSTAAIEQAARIARMVREECGDRVLVVAGGPHEDDVEPKMAVRLDAVDLSIAGDAEHVLAAVLEAYLGWPGSRSKDDFLIGLPARIGLHRGLQGRGSISSRAWGIGAATQPFDFGSIGLESIAGRPWKMDLPRFSVFDGIETLPLMVSRGCSYGQCTFCAEAVLGRGGQDSASDFSFIEALAEAYPDAALYFQDSIFPSTSDVRERLLPLLKELGRPWGAQVYLRTLSERFLDELVGAGATYIYTGLESASAAVTAAAGKPGLNLELVTRRLAVAQALGLRVGLSFMLGVMSTDGELIESPASVRQSRGLLEKLRQWPWRDLYAYLNVQTVLPGTALARGLHSCGAEMDFYSMPRTADLAEFEDGGIGHNAFNLGLKGDEQRACAVLDEILEFAEDAASPVGSVLN